MHECPECGQTCDCDGEDTWNDVGSSDWLNCSHECEDFEEDDLMPDLDELDDEGNMVINSSAASNTGLQSDGALCSCLHPGQLTEDFICQKCGLPYLRPAAKA